MYYNKNTYSYASIGKPARNRVSKGHPNPMRASKFKLSPTKNQTSPLQIPLLTRSCHADSGLVQHTLLHPYWLIRIP